MQIGDMKQYLQQKFHFAEDSFQLLEIVIYYEDKVSAFILLFASYSNRWMVCS
jgi:hypothetical protein